MNLVNNTELDEIKGFMEKEGAWGEVVNVVGVTILVEEDYQEQVAVAV